MLRLEKLKQMVESGKAVIQLDDIEFTDMDYKPDLEHDCEFIITLKDSGSSVLQFSTYKEVRIVVITCERGLKTFMPFDYFR